LLSSITLRAIAGADENCTSPRADTTYIRYVCMYAPYVSSWPVHKYQPGVVFSAVLLYGFSSGSRRKVVPPKIQVPRQILTVYSIMTCILLFAIYSTRYVLCLMPMYVALCSFSGNRRMRLLPSTDSIFNGTVHIDDDDCEA